MFDAVYWELQGVRSMKITLAFEGGSREGLGSGFGSYALVKGNQRTVTRLEFGNGISSQDAVCDTLIMALKALARQEAPSQVALEIKTSNQGLVNLITCPADALEPRIKAKHDQVMNLLQLFGSYQVVRTSREQAAQFLNN
jgi:hypothetical protein